MAQSGVNSFPEKAKEAKRRSWNKNEAGIKTELEQENNMAARDTIRKKPKDTKGTFIRLLRYIGRYKWILLLVFALCFISNILALLGPSMAGAAINEAAAGAG